MTIPPQRGGLLSGLRERSTRTALGTGLLALILLVGSAAEWSREQRNGARRTAHSLAVFSGTGMLKADLAIAANEARAFLLERRPESVRRFEAAERQVAGGVTALAGIVARDGAQLAMVVRIRPLIEARLDVLRRLIEHAPGGDPDDARQRAITQFETELADQINTSIMEMRAFEQERRLREEDAARQVEIWLVAGVLACGIVAAGAVLLSVAGMRARQRQVAHGAQIRASEERFRAMAESIPNVVFETDIAGQNIFVNAIFQQYTGMSARELSGSGWLRILHPDDVAPSSAAWSHAVETGGRYQLEYRFRRTDGAFRWFLGRATPIVNAQGAIVRWVGTATDIDDRKRAEAVLAQDREALERRVGERTADLAASEARLRESEARFRLLAENASDMVSRTGPDGTIRYVSPAAEDMFGCSAAAFTAEILLARIHPDDLSDVLSLRRRLLGRTSEPETHSFRIVHPERGERWIETSAKPLRDGFSGEPDGYVAILRDVTARRRLADSERYSHKMEAIGRIAAGVAHDFNNILQAVIGGLELALDDVEPGSSMHEFAVLALGSARRGAYLTHHLLSYARKQVLQPREVDLVPFLNEMRSLLSRTLGRHITVELTTSPDLPAALVDPNQLQTAILNLAVNAAHAMPTAGTLKLSATHRKADAAGENLVTVTIADTGRGMNAETLARACEPFYTTKGLEGTGLGLSMVQGFLAQSGGRLHIASTPGTGTTIEMHLPARPALPRQQIAANPAADPVPKGRVLLVDDEPDILVTTAAFLDRMGLMTVRASSGDEALALLSGGGAFDALITDYAMPGLNGANLVLEAQAITPGMPSLIITGFADVHELLTLPGATRVLKKPFRRDELTAALAQLLGAAHAHQAVQPLTDA